jgi:hypothetical protein
MLRAVIGVGGARVLLPGGHYGIRLCPVAKVIRYAPGKYVGDVKSQGTIMKRFSEAVRYQS